MHEVRGHKGCVISTFQVAESRDWMYAGAGAADITNWCRTALIIDVTEDPRIFRFIAAKRSQRIGWENDLTGGHFAHGEGGIYWRNAESVEIEKLKTLKRKRRARMTF